MEKHLPSYPIPDCQWALPLGVGGGSGVGLGFTSQCWSVLLGVPDSRAEWRAGAGEPGAETLCAEGFPVLHREEGKAGEAGVDALMGVF